MPRLGGVSDTRRPEGHVGTEKRGWRRQVRVAAFATSLGILLGLYALTPGTTFASGLGTQEIHNLHSGLCLTPPNITGGSQIEQASCTDAQNRLWDVVAGSAVPLDCEDYSCIGLFWMLKDEYSGLCLDVYQGKYANGTRVVQWPCNPSDEAEQFELGTYCGTPPADYWIEPYNDTAFRVEVYGASTASGGLVDIWAPNLAEGFTGSNQCFWNYPG
jgi:Ricin-type beta-trefoil lectin domain-like